MQRRWIRTVCGDIAPETLGYCQCHEHLLLAKGKAAEIDPALCMEDEQKSLQELRDYSAAGGRSLVDAQPVGCGRMAEGLRRIAEKSGVQIIASTGFHKLLFYPPAHFVYTQTEDWLTDLFVSEIEQGMYLDSQNGERPFQRRGSARAGAIKVASDGRELTKTEEDLPVYRKLFRAAGRAAKKTGAPVLTHLEMGEGAACQWQALTEEGVLPGQIIMSHLDRVIDRADLSRFLQAADSGVYLQFDTIGRFKYHDDETEAWLIRQLCEKGFSGQILLGLDTTAKRMKHYGGEIGLTYLLDSFRKTLERAGVGADLFAQFTRINPQKALCFQETAEG